MSPSGAGPAARVDRDLARGPGRLGDAIGLRHPVHNGVDAIAGPIARLACGSRPVADIATGPRVGVAGAAGTSAFPWRFWMPGEPTVSPFRFGRGAGPVLST